MPPTLIKYVMKWSTRIVERAVVKRCDVWAERFGDATCDTL